MVFLRTGGKSSPLRQRAEQAEALLGQERVRSQVLLARLQELGIDPE